MQVDIERLISSQLKTNALKSLFFDENFYSGSEFCFACSDYTINAFLEAKNSVLKFINNIEQKELTDIFVEYTVDLIIKTLQDINQFLVFGTVGKDSVKRIYSQFLSSVKAICQRSNLSTEEITAVFIQHYINLRDALITTNGTKVFEEYKASPIVCKKVCCEYTPQFQLEVLHVDISELKEPVLDLGCGQSAGLVQHLIEQGIDTYGADRNAEDHPRLFNKDWFDLELEPKHWGTVISHMALSNHIRHAEQHGKGKEYEEKYHEILRSLKKGGMFIYAPGIKELEDSLPETYHVQRITVTEEGNLYSTKVTKL